MDKQELNVGDTIAYTTNGGKRRIVKVTDLDEKDGELVFDGTVVHGYLPGCSVWGYLDQVDVVLERASVTA